MGQTALLLSELSLEVVATRDIDAFVDARQATLLAFDEFLKAYNLEFDFLSNDVWMPKETQYTLYFEGRYLEVYIADVVFVMLSKAKMAKTKNRQIIIEYLNSEEFDPIFFDLADRYDLDLEELFNG